MTLQHKRISLQSFAFMVAVAILIYSPLAVEAARPPLVIVVPPGEEKEEYQQKYLARLNELRVTIVKAQEAGILVPIPVLYMVGQDTSKSLSFTVDMTIGDEGLDVIALQNFLMRKGHSIPAGATGNFGPQTQSALAAYQAENGIPSFGYFGSRTRAHIQTTEQ